MLKYRMLSAIAACGMLAGCATMGGQSPAPSTSPVVVSAVQTATQIVDQATTVCDQTSWDEIGLKLAWKQFDHLLDYVDAKHLAYGTPEATRTRAALVKIRAALRSVSGVHDACSSGSWQASMAALRKAFVSAGAVIN